MSKVKTRNFHMDTVGEVIKFSSDVSVDNSGTFRITIPEYISNVAKHYAKNREDIWVDQPRKNWAVFGRELKTLERFVEDVLEAYAKPTKEKRMVIAYRTDIKYSAVIDPEGRAWPNGTYCQRNTPEAGGYDGKWCGNLHATERSQTFSLGVGAAVYEETCLTRGGHQTWRYERMCCNDAEDREFGEGGKLLASFVGINLHPTERYTHRRDPDIKIIPYTEEAAQFFARVMLSLAKLCYEVESRFATDESVQAMIDQQSKLLPFENPE